MTPKSAVFKNRAIAPSSQAPMAAADAVFSGGGETGALMRSLDWSRTPLGPVADWPQSLKTVVRIILNSRYPMFVWWGRELINLYNDPYRAFLGTKHPDALGKSAQHAWGEIWPQIGPRAEAVFGRGEATFDEALFLMLDRYGYPEETYFTFSYSPLPDDHGGIGGLFCAVTEETERVIGERRLRVLREIGAAMAESRTSIDVCQAAARALSTAGRDLPFVLIYLVQPDRETLMRVGRIGIPSDHRGAPARVSNQDSAASSWPFAQVMQTREMVVVENLRELIADLPTGEWSAPPERAVLVPIAKQRQTRQTGILLLGLNPHRPFDEEFRGFVSLLANQIAGGIANAVAYETARQRADSLAQLDHAKTLFFTNISHELRTPLTLMLGPLEEVLSRADGRLTNADRQELTVARRNSLRLHKLVNTLLDFSRIESGRVKTVFEATDLASFTVDVATVFRSAMEKAGLQFPVNCESLPELIYVDRDMWEKIILNLLSNAFKFTLEGEVSVSLKLSGESVELAVHDTGVGIPQEQLPRVFERFYHAENTRARTHEGTGIGLAFVQELVKLHGGTVRVSSTVGEGSTFVVSIPRRRADVPQEPIPPERPLRSVSRSAEAYVEELQQWLPQASGATEEATPVPEVLLPATPSSTPATERPRIVLADDNADMREYVARLLGQDYEVHATRDGVEAMDAVIRIRPVLVVADVMMPRLDGFGLVAEIRNHPELNTIPVILLSARAGEESRVEGFHAGADDYLVKPFTARELLARVATHVKMGNLRQEAAAREADLRAQAELERHRLEQVLAAAQIGAWEWDLTRNAWDCSAELCHMLDIPSDDPERARQIWTSRIDPAHRPMVEQELEAARHAASMELEYRYNHPQNGIRWLYCKGRRLRDQSRMFGVLVDLTDRKQVEEAQQRLASIVESSDDAIVSKDLNGIVTSWNAGAQKIFGYTAEEMIGRSIITVIPPELHSDEKRILEAIARGERIEHFETIRTTKSGRKIEVSLTLSPIRDESGKIVGVAKIARDITQRKQAEEALRTAERLASVGRLAATVAHEVNNPLAAVTNLVYLARSAADRNDVRKYLVTAEEELQRVAHITKQTLGFYRETTAASPTKVGSLVGRLLTVFSSRTRNKPIDIRTEIKNDPEIIAVPGEIRQVISNLLSNSIDAVEGAGSVRLRIAAAREWNARGRKGVRLTVGDTGCGIPREDRVRLFEPFFTTKNDVGTGLGLWVTNNIVERHGGAIRIKSSAIPGRSWTVFSVFLPADGKPISTSQRFKRAT